MIKGFKEFIMKGNAIELAVGVVIGAAFTAVVNAIVSGLINPLIAGLVGKPNFDDVLVIPVGHSALHLGLILTALINFLLVALAVYLVIVWPMNALRAHQEAKRAEGEVPEVELTELDVLKSIDEKLGALDSAMSSAGNDAPKHAE